MFRLTFSILLLALYGCNASLPVSKYARYNEFEYKNEQPEFHFKNEKLGISGNWWWNGNARAIPKIRYIPDSIKALLKSYTKEHGPVLFTTFNPSAQRFKRGEYRKVTKYDVRRKHKFIQPFFETVFITDAPFQDTNGKYWLNSSNRTFTIFVRKLINKKNDFRTLELIATESARHYTFVCIMDKSFIKNQKDSTYQVEQFINDVQARFTRRLEPKE
ncbi:MAG: hypothetical protein ABIN89_13210 [Chitinophagaceae bacterium]